MKITQRKVNHYTEWQQSKSAKYLMATSQGPRVKKRNVPRAFYIWHAELEEIRGEKVGCHEGDKGETSFTRTKKQVSIFESIASFQALFGAESSRFTPSGNCIFQYVPNGNKTNILQNPPQSSCLTTVMRRKLHNKVFISNSSLRTET